MKGTDTLTMGIERGADGYAAGWCFEMPGCYALIPPGSDPIDRMGLAILEYSAWSHNRSADRLVLDAEHLTIAQVFDAGADLRSGDGGAFFLNDGEPASPREFPAWASAHDLASDDLREVLQTLPQRLLEHELDVKGRTIASLAAHAAATERWFAMQLIGKDPPRDERADRLRDLRDAHHTLQEAICGVPPALRVRRDTSPLQAFEEWSVRKVMRRSICHLRYHTWEIRRAISGLWLG